MKKRPDERGRCEGAAQRVRSSITEIDNSRAEVVQSQACDRRDPYRRKCLTSAIFTQQGVELKQPA